MSFLKAKHLLNRYQEVCKSIYLVFGLMVHGTTRGLVSIARGWVYIHGLVLSSYCYLFLFIMAFLFLLGGGLLTAISFRPLEVRERLGEWSYPIATSKNIRVAGPGLILLGIVMAITSLVLCQASRRLYANSRLTVLPTCIIQQADGHTMNANPGFHSCHDSPQHIKAFSENKLFDTK